MKQTLLSNMTDEEINQFINLHLPVKKKEKQMFGEVFTPPDLIEKVLDMFPNAVWSNSSFKWLDPTAGVGFFMIAVYRRLMRGLEKWQPNASKRSHHILHNMLYQVELNPNNARICKTMFVNVQCMDALDLPKEQTYNCIIGNPPFQDNHGHTHTGKRINGGKNKLYERIFMHTTTLLEPNGFLAYIVPDNLFAGNGSDAYQVLLQHRVYDVHFVQKAFVGVQQPVCYFLMQRTNAHSKPMTITNNEGVQSSIKLTDRPVNPIRNWTTQTEQMVVNIVGNVRNRVTYHRGQNMSAYQHSGNKYKLAYSPNKWLHTSNVELATGIGQPKIIVFAMSPKLQFVADFKGQFGAGPNTFIIPIQSATQGAKIVSLLNSKECQTLAEATRTSRQYLKVAFIEHLKLPETTKLTTKLTRKTHLNKTNKNKYKKSEKNKKLKITNES